MDIQEQFLEPRRGAGTSVEKFGSTSLSRVLTRSLECIQRWEVGSDQLPILQDLETRLEDIKSSVTQSSQWKPESHIVFGIVDVPEARGCNDSFKPLVEFLRPRCFLSVAFIGCLIVSRF